MRKFNLNFINIFLKSRINLLVTNLFLFFYIFILESPTEDYKNIMDVNVIAAAICIRETVKIMREKNTAGHIININR